MEGSRGEGAVRRQGAVGLEAGSAVCEHHDLRQLLSVGLVHASTGLLRGLKEINVRSIYLVLNVPYIEAVTLLSASLRE